MTIGPRVHIDRRGGAGARLLLLLLHPFTRGEGSLLLACLLAAESLLPPVRGRAGGGRGRGGGGKQLGRIERESARRPPASTLRICIQAEARDFLLARFYELSSHSELDWETYSFEIDITLLRFRLSLLKTLLIILSKCFNRCGDVRFFKVN